MSLKFLNIEPLGLIPLSLKMWTNKTQNVSFQQHILYTPRAGYAHQEGARDKAKRPCEEYMR